MINFPELVSKNINSFTGRAWLLSRILEWLDQSDEQLLLLTGGFGTGKSMIVAWASGYGPLPRDPEAKEQLFRLRSLVKATHFCQAGARNITPQALAENIANQLTEGVVGFGDALSATLADRVQITATISAQSIAAGGSVTGNYIGRIDLGMLGDELSFDRAFMLPVKKLYRQAYAMPMLLLIDALDEAITYGGVTIPDLLSQLKDLPPPVRIIATTRDDPRVLKFFRRARTLDLIADAAPDVNDVEDYARHRLASLVPADHANTDNFANRLAIQAKGVFLYAAIVLDELQARNVADLPNLDNYPLPDKLSGLYHDFLNRELGRDDRRWFEMYEPLLGLIAVGRGDGLSSKQLTDIIGQDIRSALRAIKQYLSGELPDGPFRLSHKSFADFLLEDKNNLDYHIDVETVHRRIADYYWFHKTDWSNCDPYGLTYLPLHLKEGGGGDRLLDLMKDTTWMAVKHSRFRDALPLLDDLSLAMLVALDRSPAAIDSLVRNAAIKSRLIGTGPPLVIDALARAGHLRRAQLLAENATFPLDRCRALSWLAERLHEQKEYARGLDCLDDAVAAAKHVTGSFSAMAISFCVDAACAMGEAGRARELLRDALNSVRDAARKIESHTAGQMREREHLIFWIARATRTALGNEGLSELRDLIPEDRYVWNLDLQIRGIIADIPMLDGVFRARQESEWHPSVAGNLALALADAGRIEAAQTLINSSRNDNYADNNKRMAWALALCNDWDRAFEVAVGIGHTEEAVRALYRIQNTAQVRQVGESVQIAADLAEKRLRDLYSRDVVLESKRTRNVSVKKKSSKIGQAESAFVAPEQRWRVEAWVAHILAVAGRFDHAVELAEEVCRRNVPSVEANSLCYPTHYSANRRQHVLPQDPVDVEAFSRELRSVRETGQLPTIRAICNRLERQTGHPAWREMEQALTAMQDSEPLSNRTGWLNALVGAAQLGRAEVEAVVQLHGLVSWGDWPAWSEARLLKALSDGDKILLAASAARQKGAPRR